MNHFPIMMLLALAGGLACGATDTPAHIVQPLPDELNPRLAPPFRAPADIVRPLTEEETSQRAQDLAPLSPAHLLEDGKKAISSNNARNKAVDEQIRQFRDAYHVDIHATASQAPPATVPAPEKNAEQAPPTNVTSEEGTYFDMKEGLLVFMKNVRVRNPQFSLDCDGDLKIYLEYVEKDGKKKPSERRKDTGKAQEQPQPALPNGGNFDFNSIKKVAASGNVKAHYTDKDGNLNECGADSLTYNAKTGEIILVGSPFVITSQVIARDTRKSKDAFIRIYADGNMYGSRTIAYTLRNLDMKISDDKKSNSRKKQ